MPKQDVHKRKDRRGVAATEFAVVLPPVLVLIMGIIEVARVFTVQHTLQEASMIGCRLYSIQEKSQADATNMIEMALDDANISGYTIAYDPPTKNEITDDLQPVTVTVSVPYGNVSLGVGWFMNGKIVTSRSVLPADTQGASAPSGP